MAPRVLFSLMHRYGKFAHQHHYIRVGFHSAKYRFVALHCVHVCSSILLRIYAYDNNCVCACAVSVPVSVPVSVAMFGIRNSFVWCTYTAGSWTSSSQASCATWCGVWRSSLLRLMWTCCRRCCGPQPPGQRSAHTHLHPPKQPHTHCHLH